MQISKFFEEAANEVELSAEERKTYAKLVNLYLWTVKKKHELNEIPADEFDKRDETGQALEKFETDQLKIIAIASKRELEAFQIFLQKCMRSASLSQSPG